MNNIYKVIWSKAKNCYVVASEIARSHTKSASGSEKIGGVTRRSLLASLMALSLLCGGLGVAEATVHVNEGTGVTHEVYTTGETYSREVADAKLDLKADKTDVATNTANIATNADKITKLENDKLDKALASETYATKDALNDLKTVVNGKADATALDGKANKADVYSKTDADTTFATKTELNAKADTTALEAKADRTYVDQKFTEAGTNVDNKLEDYYNKTEVDGKITAEENARNTAINTAIGLERNDRNAAINTAINGEVTNRNQAIDNAIAQEVTDRNAAVTNAKAELQAKITAEETARTNTDIAFNTRLAAAEGKIGANETAIGELKAKDTELEGKITTLEGSGVKYDTAVKDKITLAGAGGTTITNLKDATLSDSSTDAVTGKQLNKTNENLAAEVTARTNKDTELEEKITKNSGDITDLKAKDIELAGKIQTNADNIQNNKNDITTIKQRTAGIKRNDATNETTIEGNVTVDNLGNVKAKGDVTADGKLKGEGVDAGAGAITTTGAVNAGSLKVENASNLKGDVTMDKTLSVTGDTKLGALNVTGESSLKNTKVDGTLTTTGKATFQEAVEMNKGLTVTSGDTTLKGTKVDGKLTVTDEADLKNTKVDGTLNVTDATTLEGALTAEKDATFEKDVTVKGTTNLKNTTVDGDLKVTGTITTDKMVFGDPATNNYTEIDKGKVTSKNSVVNGEGQLITSSSIFNAEENKVGFANNTTGDQSFHKQTSDVIMDNVKDLHNSNNRTQTKTETKDIITDENGNSSTTSQTASENKTYLKDKDGKNTNSTIDTAKGYDKTIKGENGETSTKQDELNITNTAQNGTITNDAKNIVNNASENITTTAKTMNTTVSGQATESYGGLNTTVNGAENHTVNGKQINTVGDGQINNITGGQINNITGNQTTTVTGDISNTAKNITNEANTKLTDKVGTNTRVLDSEGITDTVPGADGKGSTFRQRIDAIMGNVKTDAGESEVTQKGNEITSVVGKGEATNSRVTQKKGSLEAGVTDGTNTNASYDVADASAKVLTGGTKVNKLQDNLDSSEKTITNGIYTTSKVQTALDITNTAKDGTITNDAKNIVNNATGDMTNTVGGNQTNKIDGDQVNTIGGSQTTTVEGKVTENYKAGQATNVTGDQDITVSGTQTTTATDIKRNASSGMIDTIDNDYGTNTETKVAGKTTTDVSIKGTGEKGQYIRGANESRDYLIKGTLKNSETKTVEKTSTEITDGTNKASTIQDAKNLAGSVTNGTETGVSGIHANDDGSVSIDSGVTDGTNTSVQNQTASQIAAAVKDGAGNVNASVANATTSANTITNGTKANTVISTADGTSFINSEANTAFEGGTYTDTTIKGNTITTGKVTMDYAEVMKDLGVHGNAKVDQNLEVGGTSTLKGDVTMESNAKVKKDLTVEGTTTTKTLKVTENAEIDGTLKVTKKATFEDSVAIAKDLSVGGDVTAKSYKVGRNTYIDENGINANDQKITNVADGSIAEGSKDAVNGGQLYGVKNDLEGKVNKVGANAAAMANLHPMEFDPDSKWNIAAAIGNYGSARRLLPPER